jgi:hypothetical protein
MWGGLVCDQVLDNTPTFLTFSVLSTLGQVDHVASQVSKRELQDIDYGVWHKSKPIHLPRSLCYWKY